MHEKMKQEEVQEQYLEEVERRMEEKRGAFQEDETNWNIISEILTESAKTVCGVKKREIANPWTIGREEELREMHEEINRLVTRRNELDNNRQRRNGDEGQIEVDEVREEIKRARRRMKNALRRWENIWWQGVIDECETACNTGNIGNMYKTLRKIGTKGMKNAPTSTTITTDDFKEHFGKVSEKRYEVEPEVMAEVVSRVEDLNHLEKAVQANELLNETPEDEEIKSEMKKMRDSAPGEDGVRLNYILKATEEVKDRVIKMVQYMFNHRANKWEESLKVGQMIPLFKKGDRNDSNNYRGVCLLAMGSRILARVVPSRLRWWAEHMNLVDDNQCDFRPGRSTADATQIMVRIEEDTEDLRRRIQIGGDPNNNNVEIETPEARLLDLRKAYPRVSKPALWEILDKYGLKGNCCNVIKDLHETTAYYVRGREKNSERWHPERGLREGCPTSPALFNIFHQAVMRQGQQKRSEQAERQQKEMGLSWIWVPGKQFPWHSLVGETKQRRCYEKDIPVTFRG